MTLQAERRRDTRGKILNAARKLFRTNGFAGTSVDRIVAAANVAKGTFYQYFRTKTDVALAITFDDQQHLMQQTEAKLASAASALAVGRELLHSLATWFEKNRDLARPLILHALDRPGSESPSSPTALLALVFIAAQRKGEVRADLPAESIAGFLVGSMAVLFLHWTANGKRGQLKEWFALAWKLHLEGALPR